MQTPPIESNTDSTRSIVRCKVFDTLAKHAKAGEHGPFRAVTVFQEICVELVEADIIPPRPDGCPLTDLNPDDPSHPPNFGVPADIARFVREVLWELYLQGILAPGPEREIRVAVDRKPPFSYLDLDCAVLTHYGQDILTDTTNRIQVHDPDGYLANFWNAAPPPDAEMMRYLEECVAVFRGGRFLATVVLLGIASERLLEVLAESLRDALGDSTGARWFERKYSPHRRISDRFKSLEGKLIAEYRDMLNEQRLLEAFQHQVKLGFEEIRLARNEIAHPAGREFTWNEVSGLLHNFVQCFGYTNRIIALLRSNLKPTQGIRGQ